MTLLHKKLRAKIKELKADIEYLSKRHELPDVRKGKTWKAVIGGTDIYVTVGNYPDGTLGEFSVRIGKEGEEDSVYGIAATAVSTGLQFGIPLKVFIDEFKYQRMEISGPTSDPDIPLCSSIIDYIARRLEMDYPEKE